MATIKPEEVELFEYLLHFDANYAFPAYLFQFSILEGYALNVGQVRESLENDVKKYSGILHELTIEKVKGKETAFRGSLVIRATKTNANKIKKMLETSDLHEVDVNYSPYPACEDTDIKTILQGSALDVYQRGSMFATVKHRSDRASVSALLTPYYLFDQNSTKVLIIAQTTINLPHYKTLAQNVAEVFVHLEAVSLVIQLRTKSTDAIPAVFVFGVDSAADARYLETDTKIIQANLGKAPAVTASYSESRERTIKILRPIAIPEGGVKFEITEDLEKNYKTATITQAFYFVFTGKNFRYEDLQVTSFLLFNYKKLFPKIDVPHIDITKQSVRRSTCTFDLSRKHQVALANSVVGTIIGAPKCGKTCFLDALFKLGNPNFADISIEMTPYLLKYNFPYYIKSQTNDNNKSPLSRPNAFDFLDTRGYCFDPTTEHDQKLLQRMIIGLQQQTVFSKSQLPEDSRTDVLNGVTHIVYTVHARDLGKGGFKWTASYQGMKTATLLYQKIVKYLAEIRHQGNEEKARCNIYILVTHVDMLAPTDKERHTAKQLIKESLMDMGVPQNRIMFGQKSCAWNEEDLEAHETEVNKFLESIGPTDDYQEQMEKKSLSPFFFHIRDSKCLYSKDPNHTHDFTEDTRKQFENVLHGILSE